jgi:CheY-like chemotaxis protein
MSRRPFFFLADDDTDDQEFFVAALQEIDPSIECVTAIDGKEALEKLQKENLPIPYFIFLDLNMPRMTGLQCLVEIKRIDRLKDVQIVMYSTSHVKKDDDEAKRLGAQYFFKKSSSFKELVNYLKMLLVSHPPQH